MSSWQTLSSSAETTERLGELLGSLIEGPLVLSLSGNLGAGKTCLTRGLARGLGVTSEEPVTSPSYTLLNPYQGRLPLYHFDLYRLSDPDELFELGFDEYLDGDGVVVVEWADRFTELALPGLQVEITYLEGAQRRLSFIADPAAAPLLATLARRWEKAAAAC